MERCERNPVCLKRAASATASGGKSSGRDANATVRPARISPTNQGSVGPNGPRGSGSMPPIAAEHTTWNVPSGANSV
jgi:hypothetical protein